MAEPRRYQAAQIQISGVPELQAALKEIGSVHGASVERELAKRALRGMLKPVTKGIKQATPKTSKSYERSVGGRLSRNKRKGFFEAKAGLNVAKRDARQFAQAHLVSIGTKNRWAGSIRAGDIGSVAARGIGSGARLYRGKVKENRFVERGRVSAQSAALSAGLQAVKDGLPKEVEKVRKRHARKGNGK